MAVILIFENIITSRKSTKVAEGVLMLEYDLEPSSIENILKIAGEHNLIRYDESGDKCVIWMTTKIDKVQGIVKSFSSHNLVLRNKTFSTKLNN